MRIAQPHARRQRDRHLQRLARDREARLGIEQRCDLRPPAREIAARARGQHRVLRHADLIGAGEIFDMAGDRPDVGQRRLRAERDRHQHHIGAFIDVVHQPADRQPLGHRIERIARRPARRQIERQPHPLPRIARVRPVAVPLGRLGREAQREHLRAFRRRRIDEQFGRDIRIAVERLAPVLFGRLLRPRGPRQHHACGKRKPQCSEVSDREREVSCAQHGQPSRLVAVTSQSEPER